MIKIIECISDDDILRTHSVMLELRPNPEDANKYLVMIKRLQSQERFRLIGLFEDDMCAGVAGFRIQSTLARAGKYELYINDLVVSSDSRGKGYGKTFIDWLTKEAERIPNCVGLTLDSGNHRIEAHAFYIQQGFIQTSLHFYRPVVKEPSH